jgi:hypothetical protein
MEAPEPGESSDPGLAANLFEVFFHSRLGGAATGSISNLRGRIPKPDRRLERRTNKPHILNSKAE